MRLETLQTFYWSDFWTKDNKLKKRSKKDRRTTSSKDEKTKSQKVETTKRPKREFHIVMSGRFCTLAMFSIVIPSR